MMSEDFDRDHLFRDDGSRGTGRQLVSLLALGVLLAGSWRCVSRTHRRRHEARPAPLPERLQTWEGEGGRPDPVPGVDTGTGSNATPDIAAASSSRAPS